MPSLESHMVLHGFMCNQFGCDNLREMLKWLDGVPSTPTDSHESPFAQVIAAHIQLHAQGVRRDDVDNYDANITGYNQMLQYLISVDFVWKTKPRFCLSLADEQPGSVSIMKLCTH